MLNPQPAPAPFSFPPAPAPAGFGISTGTTSTAFGTPPPAGGGLFGTGGASAPAASTGGMFGGSTGSTFGGSTPSSGGLFGNNTGGFASNAPAPGLFSGSSGGSGTPTHNYSAAYAPAAFTRQTQYKDLPSQYRQQIDDIVKLIHNHRKHMAQVRSSGSAELTPQVGVTGRKYVPLQKAIEQAQNELEANLMPKLTNLNDKVTALQDEIRRTLASAICDAKWTTEFVANSRGIRITKLDGRSDQTFDAGLHAILEQQASQLNRIERLPTPFLWKALEDNYNHLRHLQDLQDEIKVRAGQNDWAELPVTYLIEQQDEKLFQIRRKLKNLGVAMEQIRSQYARMETKVPNVLEEAEMKEQEHARRMVAEYRRLTLLSHTNPPGAAPGTPGSTPAPGGLFGAASASGGLFGAAAPAPSAFGAAPSPGGLFGSAAPAPSAFGAAPTSGGFFGSTAPAPSAFGAAPASGGLFGSTAPAPSAFGAAPSPGGIFGSTAPTPSAFGAAPSPGPSTFGSAPAPASSSGLFGGAPSTPGTGFAASSNTTTFGSARSGMNRNKKSTSGRRK